MNPRNTNGGTNQSLLTLGFDLGLEMNEETVTGAVANLKRYLQMHRFIRKNVNNQGKYHENTAHSYPDISLTNDARLTSLVRENPLLLATFSCTARDVAPVAAQGSQSRSRKRFWYDACADIDAWRVHRLVCDMIHEQAGRRLNAAVSNGKDGRAYITAVTTTKHALAKKLKDRYDGKYHITYHPTLNRMLARLVFSHKNAHLPGNELGLATPIVKHRGSLIICPRLLMRSLLYRTLAAAQTAEVSRSQSKKT